MTYFHVTGKVTFDVDTDPDQDDEESWRSWEKYKATVDGYFFGDHEREAINNAIYHSQYEAKGQFWRAEVEYDSDTLIAIPETPEETDRRERLAAYTFMVRSGVPRLLETAVR